MPRRNKLLPICTNLVAKVRKENCTEQGFITYLWTSTSPRRFVICQVRPRSGSSPGCDISRPYFLTSSRYLHFQSTGLSTSASESFRNVKNVNSRDKQVVKNISSLRLKGGYHILVCLEVGQVQILIPDEDVLIGFHHIRVQEAFRIPPAEVRILL